MDRAAPTLILFAEASASRFRRFAFQPRKISPASITAQVDISGIGSVSCARNAARRIVATRARPNRPHDRAPGARAANPRASRISTSPGGVGGDKGRIVAAGRLINRNRVGLRDADRLVRARGKRNRAHLVPVRRAATEKIKVGDKEIRAGIFGLEVERRIQRRVKLKVGVNGVRLRHQSGSQPLRRCGSVRVAVHRGCRSCRDEPRL